MDKKRLHVGYKTIRLGERPMLPKNEIKKKKNSKKRERKGQGHEGEPTPVAGLQRDAKEFHQYLEASKTNVMMGEGFPIEKTTSPGGEEGYS